MRIEDAVIYHIYPLGALGVLDKERSGDHARNRESPIMQILDWAPAMERIGANTLYLGPVFKSEWHGYETLDYFTVDERLGTNQELSALSSGLKSRGIALILDAVFNHVGRAHPIVRDAAERGEASPYHSWIAGFNPGGPARDGLPFGYEGWKGHYNLVKLDTSNREVRDYLIGAALRWIDDFDISGLRLDAADCIDRGFLRELALRCREKRPGFILMGEAVHGDGYAPLLYEACLDSVTNYEAFKSLWSSLNDKNYFELAWTLNRLFGSQGLCRGAALYSFADNHDVDRAASLLKDPAGLYPLYGALFAMPGVPSVYYGSEFGWYGKKTGGDDRPLRPALNPKDMESSAPHPDLAAAIRRLAFARERTPAVRYGDYRQIAVRPEGLVFQRSFNGQKALIALNGSGSAQSFRVTVPEASGAWFRDILNNDFQIRLDGQGSLETTVPSNWLRWLVSD